MKYIILLMLLFLLVGCSYYRYEYHCDLDDISGEEVEVILWSSESIENSTNCTLISKTNSSRQNIRNEMITKVT